MRQIKVDVLIDNCPAVGLDRAGIPVTKSVVLKSGGTRETRLRQRFLNNLGIHTRTLIHVRKIATADLWSCPAIQLIVFECL